MKVPSCNNLCGILLNCSPEQRAAVLLKWLPISWSHFFFILMKRLFSSSDFPYFPAWKLPVKENVFQFVRVSFIQSCVWYCEWSHQALTHLCGVDTTKMTCIFFHDGNLMSCLMFCKPSSEGWGPHEAILLQIYLRNTFVFFKMMPFIRHSGEKSCYKRENRRYGYHKPRKWFHDQLP